MTFTRKYERILRKTRGILYKNPLLSLGLAMPLAIIPSYNLTITAAVCLSMLICFVPTVFIAGIIGKRIASPWQVVVYPLIACVLMIPTRMLLQMLFPMIQDTLGIYFSLICVNTLLFYATDHAAQKRPLQALGLGLRLWFGAALVALICGAIREIAATGAILGVVLFPNGSHIPIAQMAMGGFILLAFFAALCRLIHRSILWLTKRADASKGGEQR